MKNNLRKFKHGDYVYYINKFGAHIPTCVLYYSESGKRIRIAHDSNGDPYCIWVSPSKLELQTEE